MEKDTREPAGAREEKGKSREERAGRANEIYNDICRKTGLKVSQWKDFPAWTEYVDGKIGEAQLSEKAKSELEEFSQSFGKYVVMQKEDHKHEEEEEKKKRAKQANKLYRRMCQESGLTVCFFHDFISWSDYVEGKMDDDEFARRVKQEIERMAADGQTSA